MGLYGNLSYAVADESGVYSVSDTALKGLTQRGCKSLHQGIDKAGPVCYTVSNDQANARSHTMQTITLQPDHNNEVIVNDLDVIAIVKNEDERQAEAFAIVEGVFIHTADWLDADEPDWNNAGEVEPHRASEPDPYARVERLLKAYA